MQASHLPFPLPDHKGPEAADYRWWDALNRPVHPHLLADCGPTQKDCGGVQLGGQRAFCCFIFTSCPKVRFTVVAFMLMGLEWPQLEGSQ